MTSALLVNMADIDAENVVSDTMENGNGAPDKSNTYHRMLRKVSQAHFRVCPRVNCPEKIIICLDLSHEMNTVSFRSRAGDKFPPMKLAKRALGMFVHTKHKLDSRHQFAVMILHERAKWVLGFTHNPSDVIRCLDDLTETSASETCELASMFEEVMQHSTLPEVTDFTVDPPSYIIRTLLLYGRSHCPPTLEKTEAVQQLQASPHFFLDVYYIHEPASEQNQCEAIFEMLCDLDINGLYYVHEVSRNPTKVYDSMSQLLAHPLQRPLQKDTQYFIEQPGIPTEIRG